MSVFVHMDASFQKPDTLMNLIVSKDVDIYVTQHGIW